MKNRMKIVLAGLAFGLMVTLIAPLTAEATHNSPPIWNTTTNKFVQLGDNLNFQLSAFDPDGGPLEYFAMSLPIGARFNKSTRTFDWTPQETGLYRAKFRVFDGFNSYSDLDMKIEVGNNPPAINSTSNTGGGGTGTGGGNIGNTHTVEVLQPIYIENTEVVERVVEVPVYVNNGEPAEEPIEEPEEVEDNRLSLAATLIGIVDNILLNPWLLLLIVIILSILLYRAEKKIERLEQELAMKKKDEEKKEAISAPPALS